jgi:curved DNA-binding protein CbpA
VLSTLKLPRENKLTYRARKKSNETISSIPVFDVDEKDTGIVNGYNYALNAIGKIVPEKDKDSFTKYFQENVHLIHYNVPKDIDLNHYFEIMNSRGEQLEKHEIIKARLIEKLNDEDKVKFSQLWENCSEMGVYIQQRYRQETIFGKSHCDFVITDFDAIPAVESSIGKKSIIDLIHGKVADSTNENEEKLDSFQPILDFSNFLLIVLKLTRVKEPNFNAANFILDDKELIREFDKLKEDDVQVDEEFVKRYGFNLLKARYYLDNCVVHHSNENDSFDSNPWKLQYWQKEGKTEYLKNLDGESVVQNKLVQLLSMFEVSFTARQRKNYLFYCLLHLFNEGEDTAAYYQFVNDLADKYFKDVYLDSNKLNANNTPNPGSFDSTILRDDNALNVTVRNSELEFAKIYGDGSVKSNGIPLFVFNYLDYKLWEKYFDELRGEKTTEDSRKRTAFFDALGCSDFGLKLFENFYFSRTRRSLEHFYPQAKADGKDRIPSQDEINCLGNYAMIGSEMNSSGNSWDPNAKLSHYLDNGKIRQVSVASLKFMIMMQVCKDNMLEKRRPHGIEWIFEDINAHQLKMENILLSS